MLLTKRSLSCSEKIQYSIKMCLPRQLPLVYFSDQVLGHLLLMFFAIFRVLNYCTTALM